MIKMGIHLALIFYLLVLISFGITIAGYYDFLETRKINALYETLDLNCVKSTSQYLLWVTSKPTYLLSACLAGAVSMLTMISSIIIFGVSGNLMSHFTLYMLSFFFSYMLFDLCLTYFQRYVLVPDGARSIMSKLSDQYLNEQQE